MTRDGLKTLVNTALSTHMALIDWSALDSARRAGAVDMAISDVFARLKGITLANAEKVQDALVIAVAEQAIFLGLNYSAKSQGGAGGIVASESVDGASISYAVSADPSDANISARSAMYISLINRQTKGTVRICRG